MSKIKIAFYSHQIDFAGTWRSHERKAEILQKDDKFEVYILYAENIENNRLETSKKILHSCKFLSFQRTKEKSGPNSGYCPIQTNLSQIVKQNKIDIFHFARSGYYEWPFTERISPIQIETNVFGYRDFSPYLDGSIIITKRFGIPESFNTKLIHYPIPKPTSNFDSLESLRKEFNIEENEIVFGRSGRPDNFSPIALMSFKRLKEKTKKGKYLIMGPCSQTIGLVNDLNLQKDVIFMDCTNDDVLIERFHKTIDVFAHYRSDGETFGAAIAQAMMYGIPVITHFAGQNAQADTIGNGGFCVNSTEEYEKCMEFLLLKENIISMGKLAKNFANENYEQSKIASEVKDFYFKIALNKGIEL